MVPSITARAPAKLNLGLSIVGRRADGYHDLISVFHAVDWQDTLEIVEIPSGIEFACSSCDGVPGAPQNLVFRALELVFQRFRITRGVAARLQKEIPAGAGLGGGSSDAAATLRAVRRLFNLQGDEDSWLLLCQQLGSDVPFFWRGGTALVEGRGERLTPLSIDERLWFVVVVPPIHISTAWAYGQLSKPSGGNQDYRDRIQRLRAGELSLSDFCREIPNDFERVVEAAFPRIGEIRRALEASGAISARMSGSGSSVFGVYSKQEEAQRAAALFPSDCLVRCVQGMPSSRDQML
ncbi:MAG TPA: 4-(cytidine 5'-diphospho)-2-C-methyl-D-erythritol kinase [Candidatus Latescibacteria bacterium]|nr:4-(cytidine 5'-diphospho)-2-C-methyl-D-erythritol kinase [Candidatus Latescibacterota bacterium]HRS95296.1 4-(cytidine 5'-diphospho)-2-C-methyl-D-erythritol kinase [Candidatus Latescibacterota bacterium]